MSHPSRVRGLKTLGYSLAPDKTLVAPFTGAWIEKQLAFCRIKHTFTSHPSRVRGLKNNIIPSS